MKIRYCLWALVFFFFTNKAISQANMIWGIGPNLIYKSSIKNLDATIMSEPFFLNYSLKKKQVSCFGVNGFMNFMLTDWGLSLNVELGYAQQGSQLDFRDSAKDFNYKMGFKYKYINLAPSIRWYPFSSSNGDDGNPNNKEFFKGAYLFGGVQLGTQLDPEAITYESWGAGALPAFGPDLEQENQLRTVLKGKMNLGVIAGIGYEFYYPIPFSINIRHHWGLSDVVETLPNSYNFIPNKNRNYFSQVGISFFLGRGNRADDPRQ